MKALVYRYSGKTALREQLDPDAAPLGAQMMLTDLAERSANRPRRRSSGASEPVCDRLDAPRQPKCICLPAGTIDRQLSYGVGRRSPQRLISKTATALDFTLTLRSGSTSFFKLAPKTLAVLAIAVILGAALLACTPKKTLPPPPPPTVKVVRLKSEAVTLTTDLPGRTVAYRVAEIRPQVSGVIQKRMFVEGSDVKEGQQLYQIDPALYRAAQESAAATALSSKLQADRYKPLAEINAVSKQDYDNAVASAAQTKASADTAQINLVYTRLLSPISGRIGRSTVTEGALVTAAQATSLATVQQLDPIYVDVTQPIAVLLRLKRELAAGQLVQGGPNQAQVRLTLEDGSPYGSPGTLQFTEVSVDETTGSVTLRALFQNHDKLLLPGMFVHEEIEEGQRTDAVLVPQLAITHNQQGEPTALVVNGDNKVELHTLVTERAIGDKWLVTQGLKAGDRVIVEGTQFAKPGSIVKAEEEQPATPAAGAPPAPAGANTPAP